MKPGALYLNFGFWGSVLASADRPAGYFNRLVERTVQEVGGLKSLYSRSTFPEEEFWRIYNGAAYRKLKAKYDPRGAFEDLYQKTVLGR
jgi:FAD/FMN-containing dehydrogenase